MNPVFANVPKNILAEAFDFYTSLPVVTEIHSYNHAWRVRVMAQYVHSHNADRLCCPIGAVLMAMGYDIPMVATNEVTQKYLQRDCLEFLLDYDHGKSDYWLKQEMGL